MAESIIMIELDKKIAKLLEHEDNYSTDIKIAMRLIRVMRKGSLSVRIEILPDAYYVSYTKIVKDKSYSWLSYDKNLPVAICKSFIQWKEDE